MFRFQTNTPALNTIIFVTEQVQTTRSTGYASGTDFRFRVCIELQTISISRHHISRHDNWIFHLTLTLSFRTLPLPVPLCRILSPLPSCATANLCSYNYAKAVLAPWHSIVCMDRFSSIRLHPAYRFSAASQPPCSIRIEASKNP